MFFLINDERTHGEKTHWDVTVTCDVKSATAEWRISEDIEVEGWVKFLKSAKKSKIESVSVQQVFMGDEEFISEEKFAEHFEVADFVLENDEWDDDYLQFSDEEIENIIV